MIDENECCVQGKEFMLLVHPDTIHVLRECYEEILDEDFFSPEAVCDVEVVRDRFKHGLSPKLLKTPCLSDKIYEMYAKDVDFGELKMNPEYKMRFKRWDDKVVSSDLLMASGVTNSVTKAENIIAKMISKNDPLIKPFQSVRLEQNIFVGKVRPCFIENMLRAMNCYVLCQKDSQCCRMTFESS